MNQRYRAVQGGISGDRTLASMSLLRGSRTEATQTKSSSPAAGVSAGVEAEAMSKPGRDLAAIRVSCRPFSGFQSPSSGAAPDSTNLASSLSFLAAAPLPEDSESCGTTTRHSALSSPCWTWTLAGVGGRPAQVPQQQVTSMGRLLGGGDGGAAALEADDGGVGSSSSMTSSRLLPGSQTAHEASIRASCVEETYLDQRAKEEGCTRMHQGQPRV